MTQLTELAVDGMTCASCAVRIEKRLNRIDGVTATVNYATAKASVAHLESVTESTLLSAVEAAGYSAHLPTSAHVDVDDGLRRRLLVSAALAVPVVVLGMVPATHFRGWGWVSLVLATPVTVWGAWPFHRATWMHLRHGATTMDTLVSLGVTAAYVWSVVALVSGGGDLYFEVASVVTVFLLAGRSLEARARRESGAALRALLEKGAKDVGVLADTPEGRVETRVPIGSLVVGDLFVVRPGETIATDALVVEGTSEVDQSLMTGEAVPVEVGPGSTVVGATTNVGGLLVARAQRVGTDTQLAQMGRLVEQAQQGKTQAQRLADRVSAVFVPVVLVVAVVTFGVWCLAGAATSHAFVAAVSVLVVACPCALGLATPTALLVGTGRAAQLGILIAGPQVLESTRAVDTVVLDKTGTVTTGAMTLVGVLTDDDADDLLAMAGSLEDASAHPVARAVTQGAPLSPVERFASSAGLGVEGDVSGRHIVAGRRTWVEARTVARLSDRVAADVDAAEAEGRTVVVVAIDGELAGALIVGDTLKTTSAEAIRSLRALGLRPVLLTGDNARAAQSVARAAGIDEVVSEVLPAGKLDAIKGLQAQGHVVAMVGDGINDAAALAQADLGIAMGAGSDVAIAASDLTLVSGDLRSAGDAVRLSRATLRTIKGNLFWAFAYNVVALPVAALGLLNPMIAGGAMAFSSVFVVSNSLRLRRFH
jgi:P-type Cu+ transporter